MKAPLSILCVIACVTCSSATPLPVDTATPVSQVLVSPGSPALLVGDTLRLQAIVKDSVGDALIGRLVTWGSSNNAVATVSAAGLVTALAAGSVTITATSETKAGTSTISVAAGGGPAPVSQVLVSPPAPALIVADTVRLSAVTKDANGATLAGRLVTWTTSAGGVATVSTSGLVTAVAAGTATITATSETKTGTSTVTVSAAATPNNECAGTHAGWIFCDDFEVSRTASYFEYDNAGGKFTRVAGVGFNGSSGMRAHFDVGTVNAGALHLAIGQTPQTYMKPADAGTANYRELYYRIYFRTQPGWTGGGGNKLTRAFVFASPTSFAQAMIAHNWSGSGANANYLYIDPARGTDSLGNLVTTGYNDFGHLTFLGAKKGTLDLYSTAHSGTWYCIESHVKLNDPGVSNGISEIWIDGVLDVSSTNLNFLGSFSAYGLNAVYLENYWNAGSPAAQDRFMDRFVVSTQRINC